MLQWATKILQTGEAFWVWMCNMSKVDKLASISVYRSKVGPKGQFWSSPWASCCFWVWRKYAAHITNWNCFIIKRFLLKIYLSIFLTCRPHWLNELELQRESEHLFYLHFSPLHYRLVPYRTEIQIFTSCFLSWLQQTCVSTGRQPPLQLPAQKWPIFIIDGVFLGYV